MLVSSKYPTNGCRRSTGRLLVGIILRITGAIALVTASVMNFERSVAPTVHWSGVYANCKKLVDEVGNVFRRLRFTFDEKSRLIAGRSIGVRCSSPAMLNFSRCCAFSPTSGIALIPDVSGLSFRDGTL